MTVRDAGIVDARGHEPTYRDHCRIRRRVTNLSAGQQIERAWFTVKRRITQTDEQAVLQLEITTADTPDGQIEDDGAGGSVGTILFVVSGEDYDDIQPGRQYDYDIQIRLTDGTIYTLERDKVSWPDEVTRAT